MTTSVASPVVFASVTEAFVAFQSGSLPQSDLLAWCLTNEFDLAQCAILLGAFDASTFGQIMQAQRALTEARSKGKGNGVITWKVSKKGAISVYGLNVRMPVTIYAPQWERFLQPDTVSKLLEFCGSDTFGRFTLADYLFNDGKLVSDSDIEWALSIPSQSHIQVQLPAGCELDVSGLIRKYVSEARTFKNDKGALAEVITKAKLVPVTVKISRK